MEKRQRKKAKLTWITIVNEPLIVSLKEPGGN